MASVRFAGAVLNKAVGAGTVTVTVIFVPLESVTRTVPLPLLPVTAVIVNPDSLRDTLSSDGLSELAV